MSFNLLGSKQSDRKRGTVTRFGTGPFGFVAGDDGEIYYVHQGECERVPGRWLKQGDRVTFEAKLGKGGMSAAFVRLLF